MKNFIKQFVITAFVAVILFATAGCASLTLVSLDTVEGPKQVRQGQDISPRDITLYGIYKDDSRKQVTLNSGNIIFNKNTPGPQTVRVRVSGQEAAFQTEVMALNGITITAQPNPSTLKLGTAVTSWPGLQIQGAWNGMGNANINTPECQITGYDPNKAGRQTVTVSYQGKTATFNVNVVDLQSIRITSAPTKVTYDYGENLDLSGMRVTGTWPGLPEEAVSITSSNITGFNNQTVGRQTLTVTYGGKTATFNVEVVQTLNGTWVIRNADTGVEIRYTFNNGNYERFMLNDPQQGTYTTSGGKITMMPTHCNIPGNFTDYYGIPSRLYTRTELEAALRASEKGQTMTEEAIGNLVDILSLFKPTTYDYSFSGNTLRFFGLTFTRR
jgi:hypothetical protein